MWPYVHCICVITPSLSMISQLPYIWYHIRYTCDILPTIYMISYTLCLTTQHCVLLIPHTSYVWHHLHYRWYHTHKPPDLWCHIHFGHGITTTVSDIAPTVSLSSEHLHWYHTQFCMTSYPLLYDIIPIICVTSYALYITSYQLLMSLHFCTYDITAPIYETTSNM